MASQSKGKSSTTVIKCPNISWREATPDGSLILSVVKEAAESATIAVLKKAACLALVIFKTTHGQVSNSLKTLALGLSLLFVDSEGKQRGVQANWLRVKRAYHCHLALV